MKKNLTFTIVDPSKEKKKKWIQTIPKVFYEEDKQKFKNFKATEFEKHLSSQEILINKINKKLEGTDYTFEKLEKVFGGDELIFGLFDLKGNSFWFNESFKRTFKRTNSEFLSVNCFHTLEKFNPDHPGTMVIPDLVATHAKELKFDISDMVSTNGIKCSSKMVLTRFDKNNEPFGYLMQMKAFVK
eukprot:gene4489-7870_t